MNIAEELHFLRGEIKELKDTLLIIAHNQHTTVAKPTFSLNGATGALTMLCATEGASIHFTTDGSTPTEDSETYSAAITVTSPSTVKAIAVKLDCNDSDVASIEVGTVGTPEVTYDESTDKLTAVCATEGATIKYGSTDSESGTPQSWSDYSDAVDISGDAATTYWKFKAVKSGMLDSAVAAYKHEV